MSSGWTTAYLESASDGRDPRPSTAGAGSGRARHLPFGGRTRRLGLAGTIHGSGIDRKRVRGQAARAGPPDRERDRIEAFCPNCESLQYVISNWRETLWAETDDAHPGSLIRARLARRRVNTAAPGRLPRARA
jgi:hypothetical protein